MHGTYTVEKRWCSSPHDLQNPPRISGSLSINIPTSPPAPPPAGTHAGCQGPHAARIFHRFHFLHRSLQPFCAAGGVRCQQNRAPRSHKGTPHQHRVGSGQVALLPWTSSSLTHPGLQSADAMSLFSFPVLPSQTGLVMHGPPKHVGFFFFFFFFFSSPLKLERIHSRVVSQTPPLV